jgi:hypothetical protein
VGQFGSWLLLVAAHGAYMLAEQRCPNALASHIDGNENT